MRSIPMQIGGVAVVPLANAATVVGESLYVLCRLVSVVAPDLLVWLFQPWFHGLTLDTFRPEFRPDEFALGFVTFGVFVWLVVFATGLLYNTWPGRR